VTVQLEPAAGGTNVPPGFTALPTAQVPPRVKVPVPIAPESLMTVGTHGPASILEPAGQGAAAQGLRILVMVMVPVTATVLAGFAVNAGVIAETLRTAIESWPVRETNSAAPLPTGFTLRVAFLAACDVLMGLKTTLITQLAPGASVDVPPPTKQVLDKMV